MGYFFAKLTSVALIAMVSFTKSESLVITSKSFSNNGTIPAKYSCEGDEVSPPLLITNIPPNAKSLALIVHDPDSPVKGGVTHWLMWNIDTHGNIPEGFKGATQGFNSDKKHGYKGMCPPSGTHHYHFMVYALDTKLDITKDTDKAGLEKSMQGHIIVQGELVGLYKKSH